ncbi:MAG TPA: hypothetical protein VFP68_04295 [Burkholderiaceae bacterium]|nr:hypothetical protein [Burkholderiaceae bacterium]
MQRLSEVSRGAAQCEPATPGPSDAPRQRQSQRLSPGSTLASLGGRPQSSRDPSDRRRIPLERLDARRQGDRRTEQGRSAVPDPATSLPLAAYLLARRLVGRVVEPEQMDRLVAADAAVSHTRQALSFGRGNVTVDIARTGGKSHVRVLAAQMMNVVWLNQPDVPDYVQQLGLAEYRRNFDVVAASTAQLYSAGNCDEYAAVTAFAYGKLRSEQPGSRPGEEVGVMTNERRRHSWAEAQAHASCEGDSRIVMDAWAEGPAVFAADSRFASDREAVHTASTFNLPRAAWSGRAAHRLAKAEIEHDREGVMARLMDARAIVAGEHYHEQWLPQSSIWQPQPVISAPFANHAAEKLQDARHEKALQVELEAVGVAMSLGTTGVSKLAREASRIVAASKTLVERGQMPDEQHSAHTEPAAETPDGAGE